MNDNRHSAYRQSKATSWTRIEMLLALYDAALFATHHAEQSIRQGDTAALARDQPRSQRLITELLAGVDVEQGELARNIHLLLMFCLMQTTGKSAEEWAAAVSILGQLREAFMQIRDEATQLEHAGRIPRLGLGTGEATLAVG